MRHGPGQHHRRSIRLRGYDYTQAGACFITLCTQGRACLFGEVVDGVVRLNGSGRIIGAFKTVSTKRINEIRGTPGIPVWQRNYYEHIVRDGDSLNRIRQYIHENPIRWAFDRENPHAADRRPGPDSGS